MKYVIVGGDNRFVFLERLLGDRGETVRRIEGNADALAEIRGADRIIMNHPVKGIDLERVLAEMGDRAALFLCGPQKCTWEDSRIVDLWQDERLIEENAGLTAEGAVAAAMQAGTRCIRECECLIIGWGRIGRAITEILVGVGAKVTVASRSEANRNRAIERGAHAVSTEHLRLRGFDVVFSTPPHMVLDERMLKKAGRDVMILDLASPPYGVDLKAAWALGLRAWREPGLPGRYCPESAAMAILCAIDRAKEASV